VTHRPTCTRNEVSYCRRQSKEPCGEHSIRCRGHDEQNCPAGRHHNNSYGPADPQTISAGEKIRKPSTSGRCNSARKKNQACDDSCLLSTEPTPFLQIRGQPSQVEVKRIRDAKIHQADQQKIPTQKPAPMNGGCLLSVGSIKNDVEFFLSRPGMVARIVAIPLPPEHTPDHAESPEDKK